MRSTLAYTSARILLFVAATGVLYLAGARGLLLLGLALVVSGIISFVVLSKQRDAMSTALTGRIRGFRGRLDAGARAEDDDNAARRPPATVPPNTVQPNTVQPNTAQQAEDPRDTP